MKKALLFDFDGTLLNTNDLIIETFKHVLEKEFPGQFTIEDYIEFIGPSLRQTFTKIAPERADELIAAYRQWNEENHDTYVKQYPGIKEGLECLHEMGIRLVIVSSKIQANIVHGLKLLGVEQLFEYVIGADMVEHVKPHPEPIEKALTVLNLAKEEVMMVGDNSHDLEAAMNAGVDGVGVAWALRGEAYLRQFNPAYIIQSMDELIQIVKESSNA
jgi:pyrophosphatase PpaX